MFGQWRVQGPIAEATDTASRNYAFTDMSLRNAEVVQAMGMMPGLLKRWNRDRSRALERQVFASDRAATSTSMIRFLRLSMQSLILGLGAYLVIERLITVGAMFAATILLGRALQPVEQIVGSWRSMISARGAFERVKALLAGNPVRDPALALPRPAGRLSVEGLVYGLRGSRAPSCAASGFDSMPARSWASSGRRARENRRSRVISSACWHPPPARCGSTAPTSRPGRANRSAASSAICRRTSSCLPIRWRRISAASAGRTTTTK